jgi:hypothetical protein
MIRDRSAFTCALLLAMAFTSPNAGAQNIPLGSHVRVFPLAGAEPSEGTLAAMSPDSLSVRLGMSESLLKTIPMDSVRAIDVGKGVRARHGAVLKGAGIGLVLGAGVAVLATSMGCASDRASDLGQLQCDLGYVLFGIPAGIVGAFAGAHVAKNHKSEQWERIFDRDRMASLLLGPTQHHGVALGMSIPFGSGQSQP